MKKIILAGAMVFGFIFTAVFVVDGGKEREEDPFSGEGEHELTGKDREAIADIISYIKDHFENHTNVKNIYFDDEKNAIVMDTTFSKSEVEETFPFEEKMLDRLQLYTGPGDRISYTVLMNFRDGTSFSEAVFKN